MPLWAVADGCVVMASFVAAPAESTMLPEGTDVTPVAVVARIAKNEGVDGLEAGVELPETKAKLREVTDRAIAGGIFGSPFFIVDGEPFWGHDRLAQVERWLATGGW